MHILQKKLLELIDKDNGLNIMSLRKIAALVGETHPQKIKHHLSQLENKGLIKIEKESGLIKKNKKGALKESALIAIPIIGAANCGDALIFAEECFEGFLRVSEKILQNNKKNLFALKAEGNSMNKANIHGKAIDEGDYVIIDGSYQAPRNGDYVLSVIDGMANIKKIILDKENNQIILLSESTQNLSPIYIHLKDNPNYLINGKVTQVIKKPKSN